MVVIVLPFGSLWRIAPRLSCGELWRNKKKSATFAEMRKAQHLIFVKRMVSNFVEFSALNAEMHEMQILGTGLGVNMCRCELISYPLRVESCFLFIGRGRKTPLIFTYSQQGRFLRFIAGLREKLPVVIFVEGLFFLADPTRWGFLGF